MHGTRQAPVPTRTLITMLALGAACVVPSADDPRRSGWQPLEPGLELGVFDVPRSGHVVDGGVHVLRIDPERFELRLFAASMPGQGEPRSARAWSDHHGLVAAINASMYQEDYRTAVSLMRTFGHVNNPRLTRDMSVLAFNRLDPGVPSVKIIDRECEEFEAWRDKYGSFVQSIRMLSCRGENVWSPQVRRASTAAIGTDGQDRILFVHVGSPYTTHDVIDVLKKLPLDLRRLMYVEGGSEAQLYVRSAGREYEFVGRPEGFEEDPAGPGWPVPNVIGVIRRESGVPRSSSSG